MESTEVVRIAQAVLREYGVALCVVDVSINAAAGWVVSFADVHAGTRRLAIDTRCDRGVSAYRLRESLKAKLDID
jgi:hypothetical protein